MGGKTKVQILQIIYSILKLCSLSNFDCFTEKLEAIKEPKENAIDEKENGEGLTNGERQTDEMIDTGDKKIIVGDDIKIILKDDENDNKLEDIHKSDSLNHVQNNMDDVGKY